MASIADAAANEDGTESSFGDESPDDVGGEPGRRKWITIHFAEFARPGEIDLFADERREGEDLVEIAAAREQILVAEQFVEAVRTQLVGPAKKKRRGGTKVAKAKGRAAAGGEKKGALGRDRLEAIQGNLQSREIFRGARIVIVKMEEGLDVVALGGDDRFVGVIEDIADAERGDATAGGSEFRGAETQVSVEVADAIADAEFAEAIEVIAQIDS